MIKGGNTAGFFLSSCWLQFVVIFWLFFMAKDGTSFHKSWIEKERSGAGHLPCWDGFLSCTSRCSPELLCSLNTQWRRRRWQQEAYPAACELGVCLGCTNPGLNFWTQQAAPFLVLHKGNVGINWLGFAAVLQLSIPSIFDALQN